jgi:hypothetical protein
MTTSRDPEKPSSSPKSGRRKGYRTPLSRRLRYFAQDTGYAVKKAGRRVTDPIRDSRPKRPARPKAKPAAKKPAEPAKKPAAAPRPAARASGARDLGERPQRHRKAKPSARRERPAKRRRERAARPRRERRPRGAGVAKSIEGFGERASKVIRGALAPVLPPLLGLVALGRRGLTWLAAALTPLRAALFVAAAAAILLGVSQFVDYRGVAVGVPDYAAYTDVETVAPAPQVDREPAGSAHAYLMLPVAVLALALLVLAARGRWQLGRVVALLGVLAVAVTLIVDVPAGLDEGAQAVAYAGVEAQLVEGFWVQLVSGAVLVVAGLLVSHYARRSKRRAPRRSRRTARVGAARASAA